MDFSSADVNNLFLALLFFSNQNHSLLIASMKFVLECFNTLSFNLSFVNSDFDESNFVVSLSSLVMGDS